MFQNEFPETLLLNSFKTPTLQAEPFNTTDLHLFVSLEQPYLHNEVPFHFHSQ